MITLPPFPNPGDVGQFENAAGRVCQCRVQSVNRRYRTVRVAYCHPETREVIRGALISVFEFVADGSPSSFTALQEVAA